MAANHGSLSQPDALEELCIEAAIIEPIKIFNQIEPTRSNVQGREHEVVWKEESLLNKSAANFDMRNFKEGVLFPVQISEIKSEPDSDIVFQEEIFPKSENWDTTNDQLDKLLAKKRQELADMKAKLGEFEGLERAKIKLQQRLNIYRMDAILLNNDGLNKTQAELNIEEFDGMERPEINIQDCLEPIRFKKEIFDKKLKKGEENSGDAERKRSGPKPKAKLNASGQIERAEINMLEMSHFKNETPGRKRPGPKPKAKLNAAAQIDRAEINMLEMIHDETPVRKRPGPKPKAKLNASGQIERAGINLLKMIHVKNETPGRKRPGPKPKAKLEQFSLASSLKNETPEMKLYGPKSKVKPTELDDFDRSVINTSEFLNSNNETPGRKRPGPKPKAKLEQFKRVNRTEINPFEFIRINNETSVSERPGPEAKFERGDFDDLKSFKNESPGGKYLSPKPKVKFAESGDVDRSQFPTSKRVNLKTKRTNQDPVHNLNRSKTKLE